MAEVFRGERLGDVEVEVEAVGDVGADPELRVGAQLLHGLGHDVGGRMPEDIEPVRRLDGDRLNFRVVGQRLVKVFQFAVHTGNNHVTALKKEFRAGCPGSHLGLFAVNDEGDLLGF
ncbi:hypothetical protein AHiyo6_05420 [Arthrobacter sp. Hiyo6]|nr:hypothetical protein AHiyo6_05420 [Arthrobacter sp. Hiyo6]